MSNGLFLRIVELMDHHDDYFMQRPNTTGLLRVIALQKIVGSFRMFAYNVPADSVDKYVSLAESTIIEDVKHFVKVVVEVLRNIAEN